ncbi:hypothetical protein LTR84_007912 [Exophiala bonariae]|uniref:Cyclin N-terminal domain-containing protein n=1 Tax=Exophiala bonariae TaxID=1690606 RepID=A0AAV9NQ78_9EURO|nr:hypothetical protein LTR84_007912 [Exophiala bonariae]
MGSENFIDPLNHGLRQKVPAHVSDWLQSSTRSYYGSVKQQQPWPQPHYKLGSDRSDVDQHSVISPDDSVSVTDSNHDSYSSDSSIHTYSTNATDPTDFLDEEDRDTCRSKEEYPAKLQEHLIRLTKAGNLGGTATQSVVSVDRCPPPVAHHSISRERSERCSNSRSDSIPRRKASEPQLQKCNRRRSASTKGQSPPCKLTRDTECTDHFVTLLIIFATRLITAFWPLSASPPMMSTCFNGAGVLPLRVFIQETLKRSRASYSTLQVALFYLVLLKARLPTGALEQTSRSSPGESRERECRAMQCGRRMFLSALMLASKYLQDRNYSARAWSKISGLRSNEINENERDYLHLIDYSLHIPKESFDNWSKIVISLSRLSNKSPQCQADFSDASSSTSGGSPGNSLADMVPSLHLDEAQEQNLFTDDWWSDIIHRLDPQMVKDQTFTQDFLKTFVPGYRELSSDPERSSDNVDESSPEMDSMASVLDISLCDSLRSRNTESTKADTPQTPVQMSPARTIPRQPQLKNLPTPQSTPPIADGYHSSTPGGRSALRCSASVDALRSMRRQCMMNANLDRCPPPRSQPFALPVRSWTRPAETIQEYPSRSTTPSVFSPASVTSDVSCGTSRSRSSSISSNSSWSTFPSTLPRVQLSGNGQYTSPLTQVSTPSHGIGTSSLSNKHYSSVASLHDEGYGSSEEPVAKLSDNNPPTGLEASAVRILLSLSSQMDSASQSVTPTPQNYDAPSEEYLRRLPRGHKRSLSKSECVQNHVRYILQGDSDDQIARELVDDPSRPCPDPNPRQMQQGTKFWAASRMALPNRNDSKRMALHCVSSAPDLAAQYLRQHASMAAF